MTDLLVGMCLFVLVGIVVVLSLVLDALNKLNRLIMKDSTQAYLDTIQSHKTPVRSRENLTGRPITPSAHQRLDEMNPEAAITAITNFAKGK